MEIQTIILIITSIISGASVMLNVIAPLTKNKIDDNILRILIKVLKVLSIDSKYGTIEDKVERK